MCGIAGLIDFAADTGAEALAAAAASMAATLGHRGPDDDGAWADAGAGVALGFRRLAIVDLSPAGRQPMVLVLRALRAGLQRRNLQRRRAAPRARGPGGAAFAAVATPRCWSRPAPNGGSRARSGAWSACSPLRCGTARRAASRWRATGSASSRSTGANGTVCSCSAPSSRHFAPTAAGSPTSTAIRSPPTCATSTSPRPTASIGASTNCGPATSLPSAPRARRRRRAIGTCGPSPAIRCEATSRRPRPSAG